jgi:hypothetical protein
MKITEFTICLHCGCNRDIVDAQISALKPLEDTFTVHWNNRIDRYPEMYPSYSELINHSMVTSPTEWVILINDRTHPTVGEVLKIIALLEQGYACVLLYGVGFMGFSKELIRKIGWWDQRFKYGGWEDRDWVWRIKMHDLALYESREATYDLNWKSPLNIPGCHESGPHWDKKYNLNLDTNEIVKMLPEEDYIHWDNLIGESREDISASWLPWSRSILDIMYHLPGSGPSSSSLLGNRNIVELYR